MLVKTFMRSLQVIWDCRRLIWDMTWREVLGRYRGSMLGIMWSFIHPLFMLAIYTFVFSVVFKTRWAVGPEQSQTEFAITLFAGLVIFGLFTETVNRAPNLIIGNTSYVKKIVFPTEILPVVAVGSGIFHMLVSTIVLLIFNLVVSGHISDTLIYLPLVVAPLIFMTMGLTWILASVGVYFRDISQTIGIITMALLFLSPIFFPMSALPEHMQPYLFLNPLAFLIEEGRDVLIWGVIPDIQGLLKFTLSTFLFSMLGLTIFLKLSRGFSDVL